MKPTRPTPNEPPLPRDGGEDAFGKSLLGAAQVGTWSLDYDTGVVSADDQIAKMFGFPPDTPLQERPEAFFERMYPEDAAIVIAAIEHSRVTGEPFCAHYRVRLPDGSTRWVENRGRARRNQAGAVVELFGIAVDLTDQQRASRLILGEKLALRRALDGAPLETVLDILARTIEDVSSGAIVSIKLVDVDGIHLRRGSAPTLPPGFVQAMDYRCIGEGSGSSGFAAYRKQLVIVADIATHPIWENDRELALSYGLRSCWATPILSLDNHVVGTIAIYHRDPRQPNEREQEEVRTLARTASLVIDRSRALARDRFFVSLDDAVRPLVDPEEITLTSARLLGRYLGVNRCAYATVAEDEDTFDLTGNYTNGVESIVGSYTFRQFGAECLRLMRAGEPYVVYDSFADERITADERISYEMTAIRSVIFVPIRKGEKFVAAMAVHMNAVREWLPEDIDLVKHVASRCWESIERARLNRYLQESEKQLRLLASSTSNLAWVAAADGSVIWLNDQWYSYTGTTPAEMEGWGWQSVVAPEAHPEVMKRWIECVESAHAFEMVFPIRGKDGTYRRFLTRANPVLDAHENVSRWVGTNTDVENERLSAEVLRQAERAAERANRAKDEFLAMLGHELRNPLAPIVTALQLMKMNATTEFERERTVIERQVDHLTRLVDDLLDVSRIARRKVELKREVVELSSVIAKAVEMVVPLYERHAHQLCVSVPESDLRVDADPTRLSQVISNLLSNAAKYTAPRGQVTLSAEADGDNVIIRVSDNGIGISPDMLPRVFELFAQEVQPVDRAQGGLGLGLSIVKNLVESHGGTVSVESEGLGRGSTFFIRLPRTTVKATQHTEAADFAPISSIKSHRILIVDDNQDAATLLSFAFKQMGYETHIAFDGPQALRSIQNFAPTIAFLDIGLPIMDGYELARHIRASDGGPHMCLVALTGYGQESDRELSRAAGFDHHLVKPVDFEELGSVIRSLEARRHSLDRT